MKNPLKAMRETAAARIREKEDDLFLRAEIERSKWAIDTARNHFEQVVDPTLIDCYIYELNAAQLRYQFLLRAFKNRERGGALASQTSSGGITS